MDWKQKDGTAFEERGWTTEVAERQVAQLQEGHRNRKVEGACTVGSGIAQWTERECEERVAFAKERMRAGRQVAGFVPASGAATRMFKDLHPPLDSEVAERLQAAWPAMPFAAQFPDLEVEQLSGQILARFAALPKGEVPFFTGPDGAPQTAFEAHRAEWQALGGGPLVFTVPPAFQAAVPERYAAWKEVRWEVQDPATDTLAWDVARNALARTPGGDLLFRPGGHGALLENLAAMDVPAVVMRNIDNAVEANRYAERNRWRWALLGTLWHLEAERAALWERLCRDEPGAAASAWTWLSRFVQGAERPTTLEQWRYHLDRPLRVAGVVPNTGQPGGGPFWVADSDGFFRPGIVEAAELPDGKVAEGTHFNPVDLGLSFEGLEGARLDVRAFADDQAFFTAEKVVEGQTLRILERPGLWNGSMSGWLTRFVELPGHVFAPVKTVFDLAR